MTIRGDYIYCIVPQGLGRQYEVGHWALGIGHGALGMGHWARLRQQEQ
ncbi:hypothetical protein [Microcoleus sp. FACHB-68]|nr:hypothetical protein [Microcoleus sp. FACHB-68]MBD1937985.1 hypothetical protein [Microcoleus sp. FACHB-68]